MKKNILSWISYDFANSSFTTVIVTVVYSVYFKSVVVGKEGIGDSLWGISVSLSMLIAAILSPILGAIADTNSLLKRISFLCSVTSQCLFTGLLLFCSCRCCIVGYAYIHDRQYWLWSGNAFIMLFCRRSRLRRIWEKYPAWDGGSVTSVDWAHSSFPICS